MRPSVQRKIREAKRLMDEGATLVSFEMDYRELNRELNLAAVNYVLTKREYGEESEEFKHAKARFNCLLREVSDFEDVLHELYKYVKTKNKKEQS